MHSESVFDRRGSAVQSYPRSFPVVFDRALGARMWSDTGVEYLDFVVGAGAASFGHNDPRIMAAVVSYVEGNGVIASLDLHTTAMREFFETMERVVLRDRYPHRIQLPGPGGANAVEAALKLARKVTGLSSVVACMGAYHGNTIGALSVTGNEYFRMERRGWATDVTFVPFGDERDEKLSLDVLERVLFDAHGGSAPVAAVIVERIQAEGGVNIATRHWMQQVRRMTKECGALLIVDDIQVGCYRTGPFFSFEDDGIVPDMMLLSKAIGGFGTPLSLLLVHPEYDRWKPGEHTGTFRGNPLAFVGGKAALELAESSNLPAEVRRKGAFMAQHLAEATAEIDPRIGVRGRGMLYGIDFAEAGGGALAAAVGWEAFQRGLLAERVGRDGAVIKLLPPLTIADQDLERGLGILADSLASVVGAAPTMAVAQTTDGSSREFAGSGHTRSAAHRGAAQSRTI